MRDCRFAEKAVCTCVPDEPHGCPFEPEKRFQCQDYEGKNE